MKQRTIYVNQEALRQEKERRKAAYKAEFEKEKRVVKINFEIGDKVSILRKKQTKSNAGGTKALELLKK